jgi:capsule polysaccharide export protein KpsE/RkpR
MDISKIEDHLVKIESQLASNTTSLQEHMRRTRAAEMRIDKLENKVIEQNKSIYRAQGAIGLFGFISSVTGVALTVLRLLGN